MRVIVLSTSPCLTHFLPPPELSEDVIVGNCLLFVSEGSETSAITLTYTFYELARNPEIQEKLYEELSNSELSLESLSDMKYLEQVVLGEFSSRDCEEHRLFIKSFLRSRIPSHAPNGTDIYKKLH